MNPATPPCVGARPASWRSSGRIPRLGCSEGGLSRVACRVLAPPEAPGRKPRLDVMPNPSPTNSAGDFWSSTTSFALQLLSHFKIPAFAAPSPDAVLHEASKKESELQRVRPPVDVSNFLLPVGNAELVHIRKLSSLTALTYYMNLVTPRRLRLMHGLDLVSTSRACDIRPYEHNKTAEEVGADGDGMAVSVREARLVYQSLKKDQAGAAAGAATAMSGGATGPTDGRGAPGTAAAGPGDGGSSGAGSSNIVTLTRELSYQMVPGAAAAGSAAAPASSQSPLQPIQQSGKGVAAAGSSGKGGNGSGNGNAASGGGPAWPIPPSFSSTAPQAPQSSQAPAQQQGQGPSGGFHGSGPAPFTASSALPRMLRSPAEAVASKLSEAAVAASAAAAASPLASAAESLYAGLVSLPIGSALVGTNNRASSTLLPATSSASSPSAGGPSSSSSSTASPSSSSYAGAGTGGRPQPPGAAGDAVRWATGPTTPMYGGGGASDSSSSGFLGGGSKATAAAIVNMTTETIRQQALRSFTGGAGRASSGSNGNGSNGNANGSGGGVTGGMAPISASGLLTSTPPAASAALAAGAAAAAAAGGSNGATTTSGTAGAATSTAVATTAAAANAATAQFLCPSEWFVVDDPDTNTRIFVIQGSDTLDHWKLNLTFDPVVFEEPELQVKVHRGVYEAALVLYDRFLPLVYEHLESSPFSKISFTGHSIGGSLATLLMLMYKIRGVLPTHSISTVYTIGAPSVFCQSAPPHANGKGHHHHHHANGHNHHANGHNHSHQANGHNANEHACPANGHAANGQNGANGHRGKQFVTNNGNFPSVSFPSSSSSSSSSPSPSSSSSFSSPPSSPSPLASSNASVSGSWMSGMSMSSMSSLSSGSSMSSNGSMSSMEEFPASATTASTAVTSPYAPGGHTCSTPARAPPCSPDSSSTSPFSFGGSYCSCSCDDLLARLQLPPSIVRNVLMARDVVPRAFACDYSPVADILRSWGASFKEHGCLSRNGRKHLYYFIGRMIILQPDRQFHPFVAGDPDHPMLPSGPEIYYLTDAPLPPYNAVVAAAADTSAIALADAGAAPAAPSAQPLAVTAAAAATAGTATGSGLGNGQRAPARSVMEALWELMDWPHPLETLADPGAYMASGIISRYHNPEHYTKALGRVKHLKRLKGAKEEKAPSSGGDSAGGMAAAGGQDEEDGGVSYARLPRRRTAATVAAAAAAAQAAAGSIGRGVSGSGAATSVEDLNVDLGRLNLDPALVAADGAAVWESSDV